MQHDPHRHDVMRQLGVAGADHLFHAPCPFDKVVFLAEIDFWVLHRCLENVLSRLDANVNKCSWKTSKVERKQRKRDYDDSMIRNTDNTI